ncbi:MAG: hypothetical protein IJY25_02805 [Bacilli bacterium]|nr:hypothetical protein [Bacilli bacterium]
MIWICDDLVRNLKKENIITEEEANKLMGYIRECVIEGHIYSLDRLTSDITPRLRKILDEILKEGSYQQKSIVDSIKFESEATENSISNNKKL